MDRDLSALSPSLNSNKKQERKKKMRKYTIRRIFMAVVTLLVVACLTFLLMNAIPGNPWLSEKSPSQATIDALNAKYGLDQPVPVQMVKIRMEEHHRENSRMDRNLAVNLS